MHPTGAQFQLSCGDYSATVTEVGATLRELTHRGRPLIAGFGVDEPMPEFNGALLAPWPNRIADGKYGFAGQEHQLPVSEPSRNTALHGLVAWQPWTVREAAAASVELDTVLYPQRGYPFLLSLTARYHLQADGLHIAVSARNEGGDDAPYGVSMHPWFVAGDEPLAEWTLTVPADAVLTADSRLLPTGSEPVSGELDYRAARALGESRLDHTFTDFAFENGRARTALRAPSGTGVEITWGADSPWLQVCTGDEAGPRLNRRAVAIEPMTCPPDAFRSGDGLIRLAPGQTHDVAWKFAGLD